MAGYVSDPWGANFGSSVGASIGSNNYNSPGSAPASSGNANTNYLSSLFAPSNSSSTTNNSDFGMGDFLAAANLYLNYQKDKKSSKPPKFVNAPLSPEQQKLWDLFYANQTDPATKDNRAQTSDYARAMLGQIHPSWTPPKTSKGETGLGGMDMQYPQFDWSSYTNRPTIGNAGPTPFDPTANKSIGDPPNGDRGVLGGMHDPNGTGRVGDIPGMGNDPFAGIPKGVIDSMPDDIKSITSDKWTTIRGYVDKYGKYAPTLIAGAAGPEAGILAKAALWLFQHFTPKSSTTTPTTPTAPITQDTTPTLGSDPRGGPGGSMSINGGRPTTGTFDQILSPTGAADASQSWDFWNNLMNGPGQESPDNFSMRVRKH